MPFYRKKKPVGDKDHIKEVALLRKDVGAWNEWRKQNDIRYVGLAGAKLRGADLAGANLQCATLIEADLFRANLAGANLERCDLRDADFRLANLQNTTFDMTSSFGATFFEANFGGANLGGAGFNSADCHGASFQGALFDRQTSFYRANLEAAVFEGADLSGVNLGDANLRIAQLAKARLVDAILSGAVLHRTDLREADLRGANLESASMLEVDLTGANLSGARVYGLSAWSLKTDSTVQHGLCITPREEPEVTVDDIAMAQFIYLLLENKNLRSVIDTITSTVVLILGRFTEPRKKVLDGIRQALRHHNYTPVVFDFQKPAARDLTETISTLAGMARFVVADLTDAKSIPQELMAIVPQFPSVPVLPICLATEREYGMYEHFRRYPWVRPVQQYAATDDGETIVLALVRAASDGLRARPS